MFKHPLVSDQSDSSNLVSQAEVGGAVEPPTLPVSCDVRPVQIDTPREGVRAETTRLGGNLTLSVLPTMTNEELRIEMDNLRRDFERMRQGVIDEAALEAPPRYGDS